MKWGFKCKPFGFRIHYDMKLTSIYPCLCTDVHILKAINFQSIHFSSCNEFTFPSLQLFIQATFNTPVALEYRNKVSPHSQETESLMREEDVEQNKYCNMV